MTSLMGEVQRRTSGTRISVVIPCFNDGRTIRDTVASLATQEPTEAVIVDDGSDDPETTEILAELAAAGMNVVRQENGGPASARMRGVASTSAPFIFPLDADDVLLPGNLPSWQTHSRETRTL